MAEINKDAIGKHAIFSPVFLLMAVIFNVCLVISNLIASKVFIVLGITLPAAVIVFPISYIINDCLSEVYGYKMARKVILLGFVMNLFVVLVSQLAILLPGASFWNGQEAFESVFGATPRATCASLLAFLLGSTVNAWVMSKMKVLTHGRYFWCRAITSSVLGECIDSMVFIPIMFWSMGLWAMLTIMCCQVCAKVLYEVVVLPLTRYVVKVVKNYEGIDVYDTTLKLFR